MPVLTGVVVQTVGGATRPVVIGGRSVGRWPPGGRRAVCVAISLTWRFGNDKDEMEAHF